MTKLGLGLILLVSVRNHSANTLLEVPVFLVFSLEPVYELKKT